LKKQNSDMAKLSIIFSMDMKSRTIG